MLSSAPKMTIKQFAHDYFLKVSFVDIYGRNIGYDYSYILAKIKEQFPNARTSRRWLQDMAYIFNRTEKFPVRRRSRQALAEDYAMALLLKKNGPNTYSNIAGAVRRKFPDRRISHERLRSLEVWLRNKNYPIPSRSSVR